MVNGKNHLNEIIVSQGVKSWFLDGKLHREDGPAVEFDSGNLEWYINGQLHREDGPAIIKVTGDKFWYKNGQLHREDGPAVEFDNGSKTWCINGNLHRLDGPAFISRGRDCFWYIKNVHYDETQFYNFLQFPVRNGNYILNKNDTIFIKYDQIKLILSNGQILKNGKIINNRRNYDEIMSFVYPQLKNEIQTLDNLINYLKNINLL
jgi:hypothetical protein